MLLFCIVLFKVTSEPGSLDSSFGTNGIQTCTSFNDLHLFDEDGREVLTSANGDIFLVLNVGDFTRIARYLPDGRLDSSYGVAGYSNVVNLQQVAGAAFQGDKIIVAGSALARYTADGILDSSFGENGIATTDFGATSIALQDDKIIVGGYTYNPIKDWDFALACYTVDGKLDSSFGENGIVTTDFNNTNDHANAIVLQGDKILVAGSNYSYYDFALARYTSDGILDSSFGVNGLVTTDFNNSYDEASSIALQGDKIIVAGSANYNGNYDFALARYTADGALDASFGVNGLVTTDFNNLYDVATSIALHGNKIIATGYTGSGGYDFALARYTADGALDPSFGENGKVTTDFHYYDVVNSVTLQGDNTIVAGFISDQYGLDFALARYTADGALDSSFGESGLLTGYFPSSLASFTSTVIQGNKVVAAGYALNENKNNDFALARYNVDGTLDTSFGENGKVTTDFNNSSDHRATSIALQGDKIIITGDTYNPVNGTYDFALGRYTADGALDSSFGVNGKKTTDINNSSYDHAYAVAIQGDKIIVAGYTTDGGNYDFALARYTSDGRLDSSFGVNGKVITDFGYYDHINSIALQKGKIIVAGTTNYPIGGDSYAALARYTTDGALDSSFGVNGLVTTNLSGLYDQATSVAIQGDNIILAGYTDNLVDFKYDFALTRYTADGTLDSSFGENGKVITDIHQSYDYAYSIALQGDKIIVGGSAIARYSSDGVLDSSFGENGKVLTDFGVASMALQGDRLYAVGSLTPNTGESYGAIAAYQLETPTPTKPSISIADVTVCESQKQAVVTVHLSAPSTQVVQVDYHTHNITAYPTRDYLSTKWTLQFAAGTTTAKIKICIVNDSVCEPTEQFEVLLSNPQNATLLDSIGIVTIKDDDKALITAQASTALHSDAQLTGQESTSLHIHASPNPSANAFTIQLQGTNVKQPVSIRVYDISGRLLEKREHISIGQSLHLGDQYKAGTYIIEAQQGVEACRPK